MTATLPFIFIIVTDIAYSGLNSLVEGEGPAFYFGKDFTLADGTVYDPST